MYFQSWRELGGGESKNRNDPKDLRLTLGGVRGQEKKGLGWAGAFARGWISRDFMNLSFEYNEKIIVGFKEVSNLESELHFKRTALLKQE